MDWPLPQKSEVKLSIQILPWITLLSMAANFIWGFIFLVLGSTSHLLFALSRKELKDKEVNQDDILKLGHHVPSNRFDPSQVIQLSWRPRVFLYRDFLSAEETDHLISLVHSTRNNSSTGDDASVDVEKFPAVGIPLDAEDPTSSRIEERISAWTFLPKGNSRPLHVMHPGVENIRGNYSYFDRESSSEPLMATVILYLSNVRQGGQILFPESENKILWDCMKSLRPSKGNAVVFFSALLDASPDRSSSHARCPVMDGEMWYVVKLFYVRSISGQKDATVQLDCTDEDDNCRRWAATGECERNPFFMVGSADYYGTCRKSCNSC